MSDDIERVGEEWTAQTLGCPMCALKLKPLRKALLSGAPSPVDRYWCQPCNRSWLPGALSVMAARLVLS